MWCYDYVLICWSIRPSIWPSTLDACMSWFICVFRVNWHCVIVRSGVCWPKCLLTTTDLIFVHGCLLVCLDDYGSIIIWMTDYCVATTWSSNVCYWILLLMCVIVILYFWCCWCLFVYGVLIMLRVYCTYCNLWKSCFATKVGDCCSFWIDSIMKNNMEYIRWFSKERTHVVRFV